MDSTFKVSLTPQQVWPHFNPQRQQTSQLVHMAVVMVIDLSIRARSEDAMSKTLFQSEDIDQTSSSEREAQRALLGCFYLSTT